MLRYSLGGLLLVVLVAGLGMAALVNASALWTQITVSLLVLVLLAASVVAVYGSLRVRSFCGGFAMLGGGYFLLATLPWFSELQTNLLTSTALRALYDVMTEEPPAAPAYTQTLAYANPPAPVTPSPYGQPVQMPVYRPVQPQPLPSTVAGPPIVPQSVAVAAWQSMPAFAPARNPRHFYRIGHALWALVLGFAGGGMAQFFAGRRSDGSAGRLGEGAVVP